MKKSPHLSAATPRTILSPLGPFAGRLKRSDWVALVWTTLFGVWLPFDLGGPQWALALSSIFFSVLGLWVGVLQLRVAARSTDARTRTAWRLLACAAFSRITAGTIWGFWKAATGSASDPAWLSVATGSYLAFGIIALLTFPGGARAAEDRVRFRLDAGMVLLGSFLLVWFFALGPFLRATLTTPTDVAAWVYTFGDSITVILAAALYLRSTSPVTRTVSIVLLVAFTFQVVPDIFFWSGDARATYRPGDAIEVWWYGVWAAKWLAARVALEHSERPKLDEASTNRYDSGFLPVAFLVGATGALLYKLVIGDHTDLTLFTLGSAALAQLLVARQAVELRERDRLHRDLQDDEARYRALLHHAYDVVLLLDDTGVIRYASPATERMMGHVVGTRFSAVMHFDDLPVLRQAMGSAAAAEVPLTLRVRDTQGEWRTLAGHLQDRRSDPDVRSFVLNALDRTREAQLSSHLRATSEVEALGVMAGGLAHDLNNILTVIVSHVQLLDEEPAASAEAREDLRVIRASTDRATALTRGLVALSRKKQWVGQSLDLVALVEARVAARSAVALRVCTGTEPGTVRADATMLEQVVDAVLDAATLGTHAVPPEVRLDTTVVDATTGAALRLEPGTYAVLRAGESPDGKAVSVEDPIDMGRDGEWSPAPADLAMLMALASVREIGGALARERAGSTEWMALYVPVAA